MKGVKCILSQKLFITLALLFIPLFALFISDNAGATRIYNGIYSTAIYTKNFESTKTVYQLGPLNTSNGVIQVFNELNPTGIWDYTQALSFPNPYSNKTGTGYTSSLYFTMHSTNGPFLNSQINSLMATSKLGFEGLSEDLPYCTQSYEVRVQDSSTVQFLLHGSCPYGSFPSGTSFDQVESLVDFNPESMFWCANDNPSQMCGSYMGVTLYDIDYYFGIISSQEDSYNTTIINQNQTIINQNQQQIDQDNQDRQDLQNASNDGQEAATQAGTAINNASASLLTIIGNFVDIIIHPPNSDCTIDADMGHMDLGTIDLCQLSPPPAFGTIATILIIGFTIPFAYSLIMTFLSLLRGATED